jgi:hypothetical protein
MERIMKALIVAAVLFGVSSLAAAHAEWEILDPGTAVNATVKAPPVTVSAPAKPEQRS